MATTGTMFLGVLLLVILVATGLSLGKSPGAENWSIRLTRLSGLFSTTLGGVMFLSWIFFAYLGREELGSRSLYLVHALMMLFSSVCLMMGGVSVIRRWKGSDILFPASIAILLFSTFFSLTRMGVGGHIYVLSGLLGFIGILNLALYGAGKIRWNMSKKQER